jgi:phosphatidylinositol-3-phosphatase
MPGFDFPDAPGRLDRPQITIPNAEGFACVACAVHRARDMHNAHYRLVSCVTLLAALAACSETPTTPTGPTASITSSSPNAARWRSLAGVRHVFVIVLENEGYDSTFGRPSAAPYLADTLVHAGRLLRQYYGIAHNSLPNYLAMIAGVSPTLATQADCPIYQNFLMIGTAPDGQPIGQGCIYPASVPTVANQLEASGRSWKGYMEDMGNDPLRESATCGHVLIGAPDLTTTATPTDQYAQRHDPFVYFHAILDSPTCRRNVVALSQLASDLSSVDRTPNVSFITPNLCHDGHDHPCVNGEPGGLTSIDAFLRTWVPIILASPAYRDDGLLIITFDEASTSDMSACCGEQSGPNTPHAGGTGPGGGRVGAVLLSPSITPGSVSDTPYNHYALLRTIEDAFGLSHLGYSGAAGVSSFEVH